ncbi:ABC transporter [Chloropicon primus]|uniref:ABC transporter n=2 Tax=Chloropicon primus TaxID=1764295 RepID=A0A5B8MT72_9CHLO|nr:ABC transporter [Chloropicon primus]UPR02708.1 ABC transporter [Chloropicon primus]|eukprot:QDZ23496.1 ABC transporter [Chloropicon primus]
MATGYYRSLPGSEAEARCAGEPEGSSGKAEKCQTTTKATTTKGFLRLTVFILLDIGITTCLFMVPERSRLKYLARFKTWDRVYDFNYSSMDLWLGSIARAVFLLATVGAAWRRTLKSSFGAPVMPVSDAAGSAMFLLTCLSYVFFFAKFVGWIYGIFKRRTVSHLDKCLEAWVLFDLVASAFLTAKEYLTATKLLASFRSFWLDSIEKRCPELHEQCVKEDSEKRDKRARDWNALTSLYNFAKVDGHILIVAFACGCIASLATVSISYYIGKVVMFGAHEKDAKKAHAALSKLLVAVISCAVFTSIRGGLFTLSCARLNSRIRRSLLKSLLHLEQGYFDTVRTGELSSRLNTDTTQMSSQVSLNINILVRSFVQIVFVIGIMLWTSWKLTMVSFTMVPVAALVAHIYGRFYRRITKETQTALADASGVADEALASMSTVKSMAGEDIVASAYNDKLKRYLKLQTKESGAYSIYASLTIFCPNAAMLATLAYGTYLALHDKMQGDDLYSFILYQQTLGSAFQYLGDIYSGISAALGAADKVFELIARTPEMTISGSLQPPKFKGRIDLENISFRYPGRPDSVVLDNFSLKISPGEVVALVGPSGSGKSSLIKLIERLYEPEKGQVSLDGCNISGYDRKWLARKMALVGQEPVLFACSIKENIMYGLEGDEKPTMDAVIAAAKCANAHDFIQELQDGYDTECGEKGMQLSGGQKQRIAIARAVVRDPSILLLDEATSALDAESEGVVQEAIDKMIAQQERTVVIVAHRLSTIQGASKIVVVKDGKLEEQGSHSELYAKEGLYYRLVRKQLRGQSDSMALLPSSSKTSLDELDNT